MARSVQHRSLFILSLPVQPRFLANEASLDLSVISYEGERSHQHLRTLTQRDTPKPARIHTHRPCSASIPPTQSPGLHPGLVCGAPSERIHTHHPCPATIPTVPVPDASPPSMSGMHPHRPCSRRIPTDRVPDACPPSVIRIHPHHPIPRVAPWAGMRSSFRAHPYPPSMSRTHTHRPCPGCTPIVQSPRVAPWADMRRSFRAHSCPPSLPQRGSM